MHCGRSACIAGSLHGDEPATGLEPSTGKTFDQQVIYKGDPMLKLIRNLFVLRQAWKMIKRRR